MAMQVVGEFSAGTRQANLERLDWEAYDPLIVGGGITGAGIARDAAMPMVGLLNRASAG